MDRRNFLACAIMSPIVARMVRHIDQYRAAYGEPLAFFVRDDGVGIFAFQTRREDHIVHTQNGYITKVQVHGRD